MTIIHTPVTVEVDHEALHGDLEVPGSGGAVVVFAHGSGSSRFSPRNQLVARSLQRQGVGTLLFDLLTEKEERVDERGGTFRFDIPMLADRVVGAIEWLSAEHASPPLGIGLFGASTGAAAALVAAARRPDLVGAVVSRGGRPDLAGDALGLVQAPTLLIVGGRDLQVLELNRRASTQLHVGHRVEVVAGATHLFEEAGALDQVADLAANWFTRHLDGVPAAEGRR